MESQTPGIHNWEGRMDCETPAFFQKQMPECFCSGERGYPVWGCTYSSELRQNINFQSTQVLFVV